MIVASPALAELIGRIEAVARAVIDDALAHHLRLTKPAGSLGRLEALGVRLAAMAGSAVPPIPTPPAVAVFAGDHGVHAEGVSPWPQAVTAQMVANFCGGGAAINAIASVCGASVTIVNVGVATPVADAPGLRNTPVRAGTRNLRHEAAMTPDEVGEALLLGALTADELVAGGARCLVTGDMGIANTTPSAALIAAVTGASAVAVTGRGTGIDDAMLEHKRQVIADALDRTREALGGNGEALRDSAGALGAALPLDVLAHVGGLEIAAIAGFCLAGAAARVPVLVDGVISLAGAIVAHALAPSVVDYLIAGHRSSEPAATLALEHLGLDPVLDLGLRLGEGTGAALAVPIVVAAAAVMAHMATFADLGIGADR